MSERAAGTPLGSLGIDGLRALKRVDVTPSPGVNLLYGPNAAGKTTVLEAISVLSTGRSFRCARLGELVQYGRTGFRVTGQVGQPGEHLQPVGLQRDASGTVIRAGGRPARRMSELTARLPTQIIHPDSHTLVSGGPKQRRRFMDWGVFHVEQDFLEAWRRYDKALRQRNVALKINADGQSAAIWDSQLSAPAEVIHALRSRHIESLNAVLPDYTAAIAGDHKVDVRYAPGWDTAKPLEAVLNGTRQRDLKRGFTCAGPHRAELGLYVDDRPADNYVSRGQQKMLVVALLLAQIALFSQHTGRRCVLLVDDLAAELDEGHRARLLRVLQQMDIQIFMTSVDRRAVDLSGWREKAVFHVEHGRVEEMV